MPTHRIILVLASVLALSLPAHAAEPELCGEPILGPTGEAYVDAQGRHVSRWCSPRVDPPVLDRVVCCSLSLSAKCTLPDAVGRCSAGMRFWCEYGEVSGAVVRCYQDGPGACEEGFCSSYDAGPSEPFDDSSWVCCAGDDETYECTYVGESGSEPPEDASCHGTLTICNWGALNEDGTVDCFG